MVLGLLARRRCGGRRHGRGRGRHPRCRASSRRSSSWTCGCRAAMASRPPACCSERQPATKVIVLTTYSDDRSVLDALRAGARGYLTKDTGGAEIRQAIQHGPRRPRRDRPRPCQHHLIDAIAIAPPAQQSPPRGRTRFPDGLTPREAEVLSLIAGRACRIPRSPSTSLSAKAPSRATSTGCSPRSTRATVPRRLPTPTSTGSSDELTVTPRRSAVSLGPSGAGAPMQVAAQAGSSAPLIHT